MADLKQQEPSAMEEKSLYSIFRFDEGPIHYTLYIFTNLNLTNTPQKHPPRSIAILHMPRDEFPIGMGFVALGSKLYCIGGRFQKGDHKSNSNRVYVVDLNTIDKTCSEENKSPFVRIQDMHKGKCYPYVFTLNEKIYVMGGGRNIDSLVCFYKGKRNFEVFDPKVGEWTVLPSFRLPNDTPAVFLSHTVVLGHRVLFRCEVDSASSFSYNCSFDLENQKWAYESIQRGYWGVKEDEGIKDYISAWNDILDGTQAGPGVTVNDTLYTLNTLRDGCIGTYHISNNKDDRSIPCDTVRGIEIQFPIKRIEYGDGRHGYRNYINICDAELVHLGDEKFCLVTHNNPGYYSRSDEEVKKEVVILTFQVVKQKRYKADDQFIC
ncbi:Kelch repeat type 1 [Corchorus olitorius]|uniref:Kelch repeat type 1 n=1 Tax=Corchorus olitorius TaxID=93759 RepID=A0A1R3JEP9_9ROSI|nr:Kelch repeat type 1 [Corchorus olitorius]